ncbi:hypothetical protein [Micromonospora sp. WMMD812]|uniref:hypothetical protein n=1 Tax=Micromonospora sp. WMMD812 TaxID=3015152 RepID=UPI00248B2299|nr:hypothetical protein [Micromonospora sp. WMMD812]WBB68579.1 hypothetical protein O7603_04140 [Micromonospora sp. WMMD812]
MTSKKSFKARVRSRMDKTGEAYTTARRQLLARSEATTPDRPADPPAGLPPATPSPAAAAEQTERIADALLRDRTGRGWDEWFGLLDDWQATARTHTEIARWLVTVHEVPGWWAQTVTVGYEQARGLRAPGQRRGGGYTAGGSRTVAVPVDRLFAAFADDGLRTRWLPDVEVRVRTATAPKSFRADWAGGPTRIVVGFEPVGETRSRVAVQHEKLTEAEQAAELKAYWRERLAALKQFLEADGDPR